MAKIDKLTPEQEARIPEFRDAFLRHGLSTEPADRPRAVAAINAAYAAAGKAPPRIVIWLNSPLAGAYGATLLTKVGAQVGAQVRDQVRNQVGTQVLAQIGTQVKEQIRAQVKEQVGAQIRDQVWAQIGNQVEDRVRGQVRDQIGDQVGDQVWDPIRTQIWDQIRDQVGAQVGAQVWTQAGAQIVDQIGEQVADQIVDQIRDQVRNQVGNQVGAQVYRAVLGQHDAAWLGWASFFDEVCRVRGAEKVRGLAGAAQCAGWWWPFEKAVIITERPTQLHRDDRNRLHSETTAAIRYPDGFGVYAYHGTRMPADVYEQPGALTVQRITSEENAEVRRAMIELYGREKFFADAGANVIEHLGEDYPVIGLRDARLLNLKVRGDDWTMIDLRDMAVQHDGSKRRYMFRVNPSFYGGDAGRLAHAAAASLHRRPNNRAELYFKDWRDYAPAVET